MRLFRLRFDWCITVAQLLCIFIETWGGTHVVDPTTWVTHHVSRNMHNCCAEFFSFSVRGTYHMKKERLEAMKGES
jgi:hypothetical protein